MAVDVDVLEERRHEAVSLLHVWAAMAGDWLICDRPAARSCKLRCWEEAAILKLTFLLPISRWTNWTLVALETPFESPIKQN